MTNTLNDTQAVILGLLHDAALSPSDVYQIASEWFGSYWNVTRSQVYRELHVLVERGYVHAGAPGARGVRRHRLSTAGRRAFQHWLADEPSRDLLRVHMPLRVALGRLSTPERIAELIVRERALHKHELQEVRTMRAQASEMELHADDAALRFAESYHTMMIKWLDTL